MTQAAIDTVLGQWVTAAGFVPVVAYQDGESPAYPYIAIYVKGDNTASTNAERIVNNDGTIVYRESQEMRVQLDAYARRHAAEMLTTLMLQAATLGQRQAFATAKISMLRRERILRMPFREGSGQWVDRAVLEVVFSHFTSRVEPLASTAPGLAIQKVRVDPSIEAGPNNPPFDVPEGS